MLYSCIFTQRTEWTEVMEVKSIGFLGEHNEREGEMRGVQRDTDENPPLRAGTDMIMGEPLVVVYHSAPPPGCSTELKHTFSQLLIETASRPFEAEYFWAGSCEQPFSSGALVNLTPFSDVLCLWVYGTYQASTKPGLHCSSDFVLSPLGTN